MGALVNYISHTVVIGFTAGAAILIAASQVRSFFGIDIPRGTPFYEILHQIVVQFADINPWVLAVSLVTLATGILTKRFSRRVPYMIAAMLVGSLFAEALNLWQGQALTGIKTVDALPAGLPPLSLPDFSLGTLRQTLGPALVITMLALTEAVSIARAIAVRSEQRIDGNQEFIGQGLSNIVGSFLSAYAASGSFNRSGVNYEAGARTPLASVFASIALVLVLLVVAPLAAHLPNAAMAGILFLVAWGLIDFHHIAHIWHTSKIETAILALTLVGTLFNLEAGSYHFVRAKDRPECPQLKILIKALCHVLVANWQASPPRKRILIASDGSRISDTALDITANIARVLGLPVTVLTAIPPGTDTAPAQADIDRKLNLLRVEGVECEGRLAERAPDCAIIEAAHDLGADLVVIGNDQRTGLARTLAGATTDIVVGGLDCAVLVVKSPGPEKVSDAVRDRA